MTEMQVVPDCLKAGKWVSLILKRKYVDCSVWDKKGSRNKKSDVLRRRDVLVGLLFSVKNKYISAGLRKDLDESKKLPSLQESNIS